MKKVLALLFVMVTVVCAVTPAYAAMPETVQPRYTYINKVTATLSINTSTEVATCKSSIEAASGCRVRLLMYLQVYENSRWDTVMTWETTGTSSALLSKTRSISSSNTYRLYVAGHVLDANGVILEVATKTDY